MIGERWTLNSPTRNSVISVTHFWFGPVAVSRDPARFRDPANLPLVGRVAVSVADPAEHPELSH